MLIPLDIKTSSEQEQRGLAMLMEIFFSPVDASSLITVVSHYAALIAEEYLGASSKTNQI